MTFSNFKVILKYNNAASYALAVCYLADLIAGRPSIVALMAARRGAAVA